MIMIVIKIMMMIMMIMIMIIVMMMMIASCRNYSGGKLMFEILSKEAALYISSFS
jgi:hypothetical protein